MINKVKIGFDVSEKTDFFLDLDFANILMLSGVSGSGKTMLLNSILIKLLDQNRDADFLVLDTKGTEFDKYHDFKNVKCFNFRELDDAERLLNDLYDNIGKYTHDIFVIIDELADISHHSIKKLISKIIENSTSHKIHLLIASQTWPESCKKIKDAINNRICFMEVSKEQSEHCLGYGGCELLNKPGQCIIRIGEDISCVCCDKPDIELRGEMRGKILALRK